MPYRVEQAKRNDFAVLYCWRGDETNVAVIFAYQDRSEAEAEAEHLNQREQMVEQKLDQAFVEFRAKTAELTSQLKETPGKDLDLFRDMFEAWSVAKRNYFKEGAS
jgi:hypothetical protein